MKNIHACNEGNAVNFNRNLGGEGNCHQCTAQKMLNDIAIDSEVLQLTESVFNSVGAE